jgi:hypothetical protein
MLLQTAPLIDENAAKLILFKRREVISLKKKLLYGIPS